MKINHNIPLPRNPRIDWPLKDMVVGDSFFIAEEGNTFNRLRSAASSYKRKHPGWNYVTQMTVENGIKGIRIWRTDDTVQ